MLEVRAPSLLWALLALGACDRGSELGGESCRSHEDCETTRRCAQGRCIVKELFEAIEQCPTSAECTDDGLCVGDRLPPVGFGGRAFGCIAKTDEHCAQSKACRHRGRCAVEDHRCIPKTAEHCLRSGDCEALDQCSYVRGDFGSSCVRAYTTERPTAYFGAGPYWRDACRLSAEEQATLNAAPREQAPAALFCRIVKRDDFDRVTIAQGRDLLVEWFLELDEQAYAFIVPAVPPADTTLSFWLRDIELAGGHPDWFGKGVVRSGELSVEAEGSSVRCGGLGTSIARKLAARPIAEGKRLVASAKTAARPSTAAYALPYDLRLAKHATRSAACRIGWDDREVARLRGLVEAAEQAWVDEVEKLGKEAPEQGW
jgi:hypothetical protein